MGSKKAGKSEMSATDKIKELDTDGDGTLTSTEHASGATMMFKRMDTNHDGFLSKDEFAAGHETMMKKPS
jgi:Ca2+-binding EF-hand superfamily protein